MKIAAIIQARIGSTRLPSKVLLDLEGKTVLEHVINRVKVSKLIDDVIIATTINKGDNKIVEICNLNKINCFRGNEFDVLDRYYKAAKKYKVTCIVRITADCPLIDPKVIDEVISFHLKEKADYTSNTLEHTFPDGLDVEVFNFIVLEKAFREAKYLSEREHVTPYIVKHGNMFKLSNYNCFKKYGKYRWTLDNKEDYVFIKEIYKGLYKEKSIFYMNKIIEFINKNKKVLNINKHIKRNEGYKKSLKRNR